MNLRRLRTELNQPRPPGVVLNVVAPSCRTNNNEILETICSLRAFVDACVKFWIVVVDNPLDSHVADVKRLQDRLNAEQFSTRAITTSTSFTTRRIRGLAMLATQDTTTPQQILSLSGHNVLPDSHLLDAYIGANWRYPEDKVFVGQTELPDSCTVWTQMLLAGNVGCFFSTAKEMVHPPWGVTADLMVRDSRFNPTMFVPKDWRPRHRLCVPIQKFLSCNWCPGYSGGS